MLKIIILALVQGLAEFLPVSSSGHLALINHFFPRTPDDFFLTVFLHGGTLLATIIYFWPDIVRLFAGLRPQSEKGRESRKYLTAIIAGSIPIATLGLFLEKWAKGIFISLPLLAVMFLVTGLALASASLKLPPHPSLSPEGGGKVGRVNLFHAFIIGCAQLVAVLPGISRSGGTISAGLISGLSRQEAFRFSFLLSLPAVAGAFVIEGVKSLKAGIAIPLPQIVIGFMLSFMFGLLALHLLRRLVLAGRLAWFSVYLLVLGLFTMFL
ncbi:MAG: undecaprenyl-diphosphate phosphatase [Candidatus Omnitrophota bacterium]